MEPKLGTFELDVARHERVYPCDRSVRVLKAAGPFVRPWRLGPVTTVISFTSVHSPLGWVP